MSFLLDLPTLALAVILANTVAGVAVIYVGGRERSTAGLSIWGAALLVNALQPAAFAIRFAGPFAVSILFANTLATLVITLQWDAVARFRADGVRGPGRIGRVAFPVFTGLGALALLHRELLRNAFGTLMLCGVAVAMLGSVLRRPAGQEPRTRGQMLIAVGTMLLIAVLGWRLVALMATEGEDLVAAAATRTHAMTYLVTLGTMLLQTLGFVLWHKEVAVRQQRELAIHDPLTGCLNRRALLDVCHDLLRDVARHPRRFALLLLDLDHFKAVNDVHGHLAGDEVLRTVADRLRREARDIDRLARFGGEEFVLLADHIDREGAMALADRLRRRIAAEPVVFAGQSIPVTVSIGVNVTDGATDAPALDALLSACDRALYRAKGNGRNCVEGEP